MEVETEIISKEEGREEAFPPHFSIFTCLLLQPHSFGSPGALVQGLPGGGRSSQPNAGQGQPGNVAAGMDRRKCTPTEVEVLVPRASLSQPQPRPLGKRRRVASTKEDKEAVVVEKGGGSGWRKALGLHMTAAQGLRPL